MYDASCEDSAMAQSNSINPIQDTAQLNSSHQSPIKEVESCEKHDIDRAQKKKTGMWTRLARAGTSVHNNEHIENVGGAKGFFS